MNTGKRSRTMRPFTCQDCGKPDLRATTNKKRCTSCADARARAMAGIARARRKSEGYVRKRKAHPCTLCGAEMQGPEANREHCQKCVRERIQTIEAHLAAPKAAIQQTTGLSTQCAQCGKPIVTGVRQQKFCWSCRQHRRKLSDTLSALQDRLGIRPERGKCRDCGAPLEGAASKLYCEPHRQKRARDAKRRCWLKDKGLHTDPEGGPTTP